MFQSNRKFEIELYLIEKCSTSFVSFLKMNIENYLKSQFSKTKKEIKNSNLYLKKKITKQKCQKPNNPKMVFFSERQNRVNHY